MKWGDLALNIKSFHQMAKPISPLHLAMRSARSLCVIAHDQNFLEFKKYEKKGVETLFLMSEYSHRLIDSDATFAHMTLGAKSFSNLELDEKMKQCFEYSRSLFTDKGYVAYALSQSAAWLSSAFLFLSRNEILSSSFEKVVTEDFNILEHSMQVGMLALILKDILLQDEKQNVNAEISLLALSHDFAKMTLPNDIRKKNIKDLNSGDRSIYFSHTQNLTLLLDRDSQLDAEGKKLFHNYDRIEREGEALPILGYQSLWCVVIANRFIEAGALRKGHQLSAVDLYQLLKSSNAESLMIPPSIWREFEAGIHRLGVKAAA